MGIVALVLQHVEEPYEGVKTTLQRMTLQQPVVYRDFTSPVPTYKLEGNITYLRTGEGWLYLATVIDLNMCSFATREKAKRAIIEYIEAYYNRKRPHSTIGHQMPAEAMDAFFRRAKNRSVELETTRLKEELGKAA